MIKVSMRNDSLHRRGIRKEQFLPQKKEHSRTSVSTRFWQSFADSSRLSGYGSLFPKERPSFFVSPDIISPEGR